MGMRPDFPCISFVFAMFLLCFCFAFPLFAFRSRRAHEHIVEVFTVWIAERAEVRTGSLLTYRSAEGALGSCCPVTEIHLDIADYGGTRAGGGSHGSNSPRLHRGC